jgi:tRNA pseudouridine38-40 synthase
MVRYKVILAYDGTEFSGSQRQARARTVQSELERALRKLGWTGGSVLLAGRTDAGVHAAGQVASFDLEWGHGTQKLCEALNAFLPADLAARQVEPAAPGFHPRFDAASRRYRYELFCGAVRDPLRERYAWRTGAGLDGGVLERAARIFLGKHDFAAFGSPVSKSGTTVRTVTGSAWRGAAGEWQFEIEADAFLYRMVRRLVFVQVAAGQRRCTIESLARALDEGATATSARDLPAGLAPAHGLALIAVNYPAAEASPE